MGTKIAICISTYNRPEAFSKTLNEILKFRPPNSEIFIVEDFSENASNLAHYTFNERAGIPNVKNKCLELAYKSGADHVFLFDDDCYPIVKNWHEPYINSIYNHLCYTFEQYKIATLPDHTRNSLANGCMMYFKRICLEEIGGFDLVFGLGKYEHVNLSWRIRNAGLTPYHYMDVRNSKGLFHCMDEQNEIERSFDHCLETELLAANTPLFHELKSKSYYVDFK